MTETDASIPGRDFLPVLGVKGSKGLAAAVGDWTRARRQALRGRAISYYVYRHRYLACFTVIGLASILLELTVLGWLPANWAWPVRMAVAFIVGLAFSLGMNVTVNFHVPRRYLLRTSAWFAGISLASFLLNAVIIDFLQSSTTVPYGRLRLGISGVLFLVAYSLHRKYTFSQSRNFGIAVYASEQENVGGIFERVGHCCDHVHVDLVDTTVNAAAAPVCLAKIDEARRQWRGYPVCLHLMSRHPGKWLPQVWDRVDWVLLQCDSDDNLMELLFECRLRGKRPGIVWHQSSPPSDLLPYLPHVDFVMVLGIAQPGQSGQTLSPQGLAVAQALESMRSQYRFELMFDGGVKTTNIEAIPGRYVVSASAVLDAPEPITAAHYLRKSAYDRQSRRKAA